MTFVVVSLDVVHLDMVFEPNGVVAFPDKSIEVRVALNGPFVAFKMDNVDGVEPDQVVEKAHVSV